MSEPCHFTNKQLVDELSRRLHQDAEHRKAEELDRLEDEIRSLSIRLQNSEKGKSQFLSNVRNEINNPLTSIIGLSAAIISLTNNEKVKRMSSLVYQQAFDLDFQMRNIIVASEIEMGETKRLSTNVNIIVLLDNQIQYLKEKIEHKDVTVELYLPKELNFRTDAYALQTICLNLLANAIEYCGENKVIIVEAAQKNDQLEIEIQDFGKGMEPEIQQVVFDRFRQGESGVMKNHGGHGLGLSIVKELVNLLGGQIALQSIAKQGTSVKIILPELATAHSEVGSSAFGNELLFTKEEEF
jgi:signal transduction histidine kinase